MYFPFLLFGPHYQVVIFSRPHLHTYASK